MTTPTTYPEALAALTEYVEMLRALLDDGGTWTDPSGDTRQTVAALFADIQDQFEAAQSTLLGARDTAVTAATDATAARNYIFSLVLTTGALPYTTRAALQADLTPVAGKIGWVYADSTAAYNGFYVKIGATGTGSWTMEVDRIAAEATTRLVQDNALRADLNAMRLAIDAMKSDMTAVKTRLTGVETLAASLGTTVAGLRAQWVAQYDARQYDYYVSSLAANASDSNAGTSRAAPFASFSPLIAMPANYLNGKRIGVERGGSYKPMDFTGITANDLLIGTYGTASERPFFDCTAVIPATWSLYSAGIYSITVTRETANAKFLGNWFRNGVPMRKHSTLAALSTAEDYTVYVQNEGSLTPTLYMKAPSDPGADGAAYRWSKFGQGVGVGGSRNRIEGIHVFGPAHQDGGISLGGGVGGHVMRDCVIYWGNRHNSLVSPGPLRSVVEFCEFRGAANDLEMATGNGVVFYATDQSQATWTSRYNIYDGMGRPHYGLNFPYQMTGPYGHDSVLGSRAVRCESIGDTYIDCVAGLVAVGQNNFITGAKYKNCRAAYSIVANNSSCDISGIVDGSEFDFLLKNEGAIHTLNYHDNGCINIKNMGAGFPGFIQAGVAPAVTYVNLENSSFHVGGISLANGGRRFIRIYAGSLRVRGCTFGPFAPPVSDWFETSISGGVCTLDLANNTYALGFSAIDAGVTYRGLAAWQAAGKESGSVYAPIPASELADNFEGADAKLADTPGWTLIAGNAADLQRKSGRLYIGPTAAATYKFGDVSSIDCYARYTLRNMNGNSGIAMRILDGNNMLYFNATSVGFQARNLIAGASNQAAASVAITPALGDDVIVVLRRYLDPVNKTYSYRYWLIVNGALYSSLVGIAATGFETVKTVGALARGGGNADLVDDVAYGAAPLDYAE